MKIMAYMDKDDNGRAIEMADAIIHYYMDDAERLGKDDLIDEAYVILAEIAEHIQTYVKCNRKPCITFLDEKEGLRGD